MIHSFILFLLLPSMSLERSAAVLLNNAKYYYNYRMVSNVTGMYQGLKRLGFSDQDIMIGSNQTTFNFWANSPQNMQRIEDNNIKNNLIDKDTEIDILYEDMNLKRHLMAFSGRYEEGDTINKRIELDDTDWNLEENIQFKSFL